MREKRYVERDGKIYARVSYTDSSGKRRQLWRKAESKSDAKELSKELEQQLKNSTEPFEHQLTLDEYLDKWLASVKSKISDKTYEIYEFLLRKYIRPSLGRRELTKLKPLHVQQVIDELGTRFTPKTVRETNFTLSRALGQAIRWKLITNNPAADVELPKRLRHEMKCFSEEEAILFLEEAAKDRHGLLFELALVSGMRPGEYLALQWSDVDFGKNMVTVQRSLFTPQKGGKWYFKEPKTSMSRRTIPLPHLLIKQLAEHKRKQAEQRLKQGPKYHNRPLAKVS
jgi:integrase